MNWRGRTGSRRLGIPRYSSLNVCHDFVLALVLQKEKVPRKGFDARCLTLYVGSWYYLTSYCLTYHLALTKSRHHPRSRRFQAKLS